MIPELEELPNLGALRAECQAFLGHRSGAEFNLHTAPAEAISHLVLGDGRRASTTLAQYTRAWESALGDRFAFRREFELAIEHPLIDVVADAHQTLDDAIRVLAAMGRFEIVGRLDRAMRHEPASDPEWPLVPPSVQAQLVVAAFAGDREAWLELAAELWDDWLAEHELRDTPYVRAMRAFLERDRERFVDELPRAAEAAARALEALEPKHGPVFYFHTLSLSDVAVLVRAGQALPAWRVPSLLPAWATRFWGF